MLPPRRLSGQRVLPWSLTPHCLSGAFLTPATFLWSFPNGLVALPSNPPVTQPSPKYRFFFSLFVLENLLSPMTPQVVIINSGGPTQVEAFSTAAILTSLSRPGRLLEHRHVSHRRNFLIITEMVAAKKNCIVQLRRAEKCKEWVCTFPRPETPLSPPPSAVGNQSAHHSGLFECSRVDACSYVA